MDYLVWFVILILLAITYWYFATPANLPPGPKGFPLIGSIHIMMGGKVQFTFIKLAKKYGNLFHFNVGSKMAIVLNDYETIKEAFVKQGDIFSGRMFDFRKDARNPHLGLVKNVGEYWKQHRRFLLHNLRDNGLGKSWFEPLILNEIECFANELSKHNGEPFDVKQLLNFSLANNIFLMLIGKRFEYNDELTNRLIELSDENVRLVLFVTLLSFFPWMKFIPGIPWLLKSEQKSIVGNKIAKAIRELIHKKIENHQESSQVYVDAFLTEMKRRQKLNETDEVFSEAGLIYNCKDLFMAGYETSANTLMWTMLYMTKYPEVQSKVQEEIDRVIGTYREPTYADHLLTPYTDAVIMEVHRAVSLVPLSVPHSNIAETTLFGYHIPKGCLVIPNLYAVHNDPKLWGDPENFRPERFINKEGKAECPEYLIPFSIGKRACAGERLANTEIYLYFVSLMQRFRFIHPKNTELTLETAITAVNTPKCSTICAQRRSEISK